MNLHRSSGKPDWAAVPEDQQNVWQRLAARSSGKVTPGNVFTVGGFGLVLLGIWLINQNQLWLGLSFLVFGRLCDLFDGIVADQTKTKSPLGEVLDAGFDKFGTLASLVGLCTAHIINVLILLVVLLPNLSNSLITITGNRRGMVLHVSQNGKLFMATSWMALVGYVLAAALKLNFSSWLGLLASCLLIISLVLGLLASKGYFEDLRQG